MLPPLSPGYEPGKRAVVILRSLVEIAKPFALDPGFSCEFPPRADSRMMFPHGEQSFPSFYLYIECQRSLVVALLGLSKPCLAFTLRIIPHSPVVCKGGFEKLF